jgi:hypothetical protein
MHDEETGCQAIVRGVILLNLAGIFETGFSTLKGFPPIGWPLNSGPFEF